MRTATKNWEVQHKFAWISLASNYEASAANFQKSRAVSLDKKRRKQHPKQNADKSVWVSFRRTCREPKNGNFISFPTLLDLRNITTGYDSEKPHGQTPGPTIDHLSFNPPWYVTNLCNDEMREDLNIGTTSAEIIKAASSYKRRIETRSNRLANNVQGVS